MVFSYYICFADFRGSHSHIYSSDSEESDGGSKRLRDTKAALESDDVNDVMMMMTTKA